MVWDFNDPRFTSGLAVLSGATRGVPLSDTLSQLQDTQLRRTRFDNELEELKWRRAERERAQQQRSKLEGLFRQQSTPMMSTVEGAMPMQPAFGGGMEPMGPGAPEQQQVGTAMKSPWETMSPAERLTSLGNIAPEMVVPGYLEQMFRAPSGKMETVIGRDGKPVLMPAELAAGQRPYIEHKPIALGKYGLYDPQNGTFISAPGGGKGALEPSDYGDTAKLYDRAQKYIMPMRDAMNAAAQIQALLNQPGPVTDIGTIYSVVKLLDPTSVVREGEVGLMNAATSVWDRLNILAERAKEGGALGPKARQSIADLTNTLVALYSNKLQNYEAYYSKVAEDYGIDPSHVTGPNAGGGAAPGSEMSESELKELQELRTKQGG